MQDITLNIARSAVISFREGAIHVSMGDEGPVHPVVGLRDHRCDCDHPALGQYWVSQGGIYAGLMRGAEGQRDYHLIVARGPDGNLANLKWGGRDHEVRGAASDTDGLANTKALLADSENHPILDAVRGLCRDGHSDFYLPARRELSLCFANVKELFETDDWFWSSTQYSAYSAWYQGFSYGGQYWGSKGTTGRARAVRRVPA